MLVSVQYLWDDLHEALDYRGGVDQFVKHDYRGQIVTFWKHLLFVLLINLFLGVHT